MINYDEHEHEVGFFFACEHNKWSCTVVYDWSMVQCWNVVSINTGGSYVRGCACCACSSENTCSRGAELTRMQAIETRKHNNNNDEDDDKCTCTSKWCPPSRARLHHLAGDPFKHQSSLSLLDCLCAYTNRRDREDNGFNLHVSFLWMKLST